MRPGRRALASAVLLAALSLLLVAPSPVRAAGLTLSTRFPGVTVKAGQSITLPLEVAQQGPAAGLVTLEVTELPEGWTPPVFRGGSFTVQQVFVPANGRESVSLDLTVPRGVPGGVYRLGVRAAGTHGSYLLPITLKVVEEGEAAAELTTQYPSLEGPSDATYTFRLTLRNKSSEQQLFSLAAQAPAGWEVIFHPAYDSKRVASIPVEANSSQNLDVEVKPARDAAAGEYSIDVAAAAGDLVARTRLDVKLTGSHELRVTTPTGRLSAAVSAGRSTPVQVLIENTGTAALQNINLSASSPPNWSVTFSPETIEALAPGESRQVEARIQPDGRAIAGDYMVSIHARNQDAGDSAEFRVAVRTRTGWGLVGVGLIALIGGGVAWVFRTFGRR